MASIFISISGSALAADAATQAPHSPGAGESFWNEQGGSIGLWIYDHSGLCDVLRNSRTETVIITITRKTFRDQRKRYRVRDLYACEKLSPDGSANRCVDGFVDIARNQLSITGTYRLTFADQSIRTGSLSSELCAPGFGSAPPRPVAAQPVAAAPLDRPTKLVSPPMPVPRLPPGLPNPLPRFAGTVEFTIGPDGRVSDVRVIEATHAFVRDHLRQNVAAMVYEPPTRNGQPTFIRARQEFVFNYE